MTKAVKELGDQGARSVINGCSAVDVDEEGIGVRVIDPTPGSTQKDRCRIAMTDVDLLVAGAGGGTRRSPARS